MAFSKSSVRRRFNRDLTLYERANADLKQLVTRLLVDLSDRYRLRPARVIGEMKGFDDFYAKILRKLAQGRQIESTDDCFREIRDIARARVVCLTLEDCERLRRLLDDQKQVFVNDVRTEVFDPSSTGYRGIHLDVDVYVKVGGDDIPVPCELQLLTALQQCWSDYTHRDFYKGVPVPSLIEDLMRELSGLMNVADRYADRLIRAIDEARDASGT
jgi:ppGpp synthetase/RelA/SpoT-type nucleotidyltranferase